MLISSVANSYHEIGRWDLPSEIDYVLEMTKRKKISYIGFSQGTTAFMVLMSTVPKYNEKINMMVALAPVAFLNNSKGVILNYTRFIMQVLNVMF